MRDGLDVLFFGNTAAVGYWRRVLDSPRGELWFAAHTRAAPAEMRSLAQQLQAALRRTGHPAPAVDTLWSGDPM